jgi:cytochrome c oxidase subunit II
LALAGMSGPPAPAAQPSRRAPGPGSWLLLAAALLLAGCDGVQSALVPAGDGAERIVRLFWWMAAGAVLVWLSVLALAVYAVLIQPRPHDARKTAILIIGGGAVVPTVVLTILLAFGLSMLPGLVAPAPEGSLQIEVSGEQWWWRVRYRPPGGEPVELANEIRLPVGEPVELLLTSPDVIHSFWIPALGGKIDMIPGRQTRLALWPSRTGLFRGVCAEYCGTSHALMAFPVVVHEPDEHARWLAQQAEPAKPPAGPEAERGAELFLALGCGACHSIRGTEADGLVGPDLTHVGSRLSLGAGTLRNDVAAFERWIGRTGAVKPEVHMPAFGMLASEDLRALALYLDGLE